ncbi:MAG: MCP four helix bundle domain-containing protein [Candidatus Nitrosopolaris sp.]
MGQITIKSKLMIGFFSIASFVVIVGTIGFVNSLHVNSALKVVTNGTLPELLVLGNIQSSINKVSSDIVGFALVSSDAVAPRKTSTNDTGQQDIDYLYRSVWQANST